LQRINPGIVYITVIMKRVGIYILLIYLFMTAALEARELKPGSRDGKAFEKAREHYNKGEYEVARDILYKMARKYDSDANFDYLLGMSFAKMGGITNRTYARKYLKMAVGMEKDSVRWRYDLGVVLNQSDMKYSAYQEFNEVIERDSTYLEAYLNVIDYCIDKYRHNGDKGKLQEAYKCALYGKNRFKNNAALQYKMALIATLFESHAEAAKIIGEITNADTLRNEITMLAAYLNYKARDFANSYSLFTKGILNLSEEDSKGYFDIELLLSPQQKRDYNDLNEDEKKIFADSMWQNLDPDLTTTLNEKMVEHFARVYMAEILLSQPDRGKHAWDTDQGQLYIRYGPPAIAEWNLPDDEDTRLNCKWEWVYYFDGEPVHLTFMNLFGGNSYALAPMDYGGDDYKAYALNAEIPNVVRFAEQQDLIQSIFSYFIYKGPDNESLLDLFVATPYDQFVYQPVEGHAVCDVEYRSALLDLEGEPIKRDTRQQQIVISPTLSQNPDFYNFATITMPAPAESLKVACAIEQKSAQRVNIYEMPLDIYDFNDKGFHLSSLILASKVGEKEKDSQFNRRNIKLIPNFTRTYRDIDTLIVYYEIYDLPTNIRNRTHYRLSYSIREIEPPRNVFGMIAGLLSGGPKAEITHTADRGDIRTELYEPLKIDISPLKPGLYSFTLEVEDLIIGKTLTRKAQFSVVEPEKD
jgi:GWxTD domain-containing protein